MGLRARSLRLALLGLIALPAAGRADDLVEAGRRLTQEKCARCHAVAGPGPSPVTEAPPFSSFARRWPLEDLAEAFAEGLYVYHPRIQMPVFVFTPPEIDALLAYLESVQE